jgi:glycine/D-amino acid oxidase-like deaminating enzyme
VTAASAHTDVLIVGAGLSGIGLAWHLRRGNRIAPTRSWRRGRRAAAPLLDFSAGYVLRALPALLRQGTRDPWRVVMDYREDVRQLRRAPVADPALRFA